MAKSIQIQVWNKFQKIGWFIPGWLLWAAFPPQAEKVNVLFALAPLLWLARQGNVRRSVIGWLKSGAFFWVATLSWMPAIVKNNGPMPLVVLGWAALAAYCVVYFAAFGYLSSSYWSWVRELEDEGEDNRAIVFRLLGVLLVEPILWCGLELVRSRFLGGFAWNQLGVVPVNAGFGAPAALGGVYLCSMVVVLINGTFAGIGERIIASLRKEPLAHWRTLETVLAIGIVFGIYQLAQRLGVERKDEATLKVAMVQRNFPCIFKESEENPYETYDRLLRNVEALNLELVVLSESAMSDFSSIDRRGATAFAEWVRKRTKGAALLAGGSHCNEGKRYNSAALYGADGSLQIYDKVHLVPFGEFIPGDKMIPWLQRFAPVGSCTPGANRLLDAGGAKLGVAICFEDTDSALIREKAKLGAEVLCFITNDSWFSNSNEAEAHSWQAVARAIETGLPVVRVGNSGVTGSITSAGKATWLNDTDGFPLVDKAGTMFDRLVFTRSPMPLTPYVKVGDFPLFIAFSLLIIAMIMVKYTHERK